VLLTKIWTIDSTEEKLFVGDHSNSGLTSQHSFWNGLSIFPYFSLGIMQNQQFRLYSIANREHYIQARYFYSFNFAAYGKFARYTPLRREKRFLYGEWFMLACVTLPAAGAPGIICCLWKGI
jgi:hypothetical protein